MVSATKVKALALAAATVVPLVIGVQSADAGPRSGNGCLSISANQYYYSYGGRAHVNVHLSGKRTNTYVRVYRSTPGQKATRIAQGHVTAAGNYFGDVSMRYNTNFIATFGGDSGCAATHAIVLVHTKVAVKTALGATYKTAGGYHYVHPGHKGKFAAAVAPNKSGRGVYFPLQEYRNGGWHRVANGAFRLNSKSAVAITFTGRDGYSYRIRAHYNGDQVNFGKYSGYTYVRFR